MTISYTRHEVRDMHAWSHTGIAYRTKPVRVESTRHEDIVEIEGVAFQVREVD